MGRGGFGFSLFGGSDTKCNLSLSVDADLDLSLNVSRHCHVSSMIDETNHRGV